MCAQKRFVLKIGERILPRIKTLASVLKSSGFPVRILLFPGGWQGADLIRTYKKKWHLKDTTAHDMALSILDMNACLLSEVWLCKIARTVKEVKNYFKRYRFCTVFPSSIMRRQCFSKRYDVDIDKFSSDSSACFMAYLLGGGIIFLKDVDGIFSSDPKKGSRANLVEYVKAHDLVGRATCVDSTVGFLLEKYRLNAWVINGRYPQRILEVFSGRRPRGTYISYE